jgi:hypothetical protein
VDFDTALPQGAGVVAWLVVAGALALLPPSLDDDDAARARILVESMRNNPRGPFRGIAWFCADGAILPPRPGACGAHGGGRQHGVPSDDARALLDLGVPVGTVLASLTDEEWRAHDAFRARAYLVERYLVRTQDGWVEHRSRSYRGAKQAEDEAEAAGRFLAALAGTHPHLASDRSLMIQLSRALPFSGNGPDAQVIRDLATDLSERDRRFLPLRARIHGQPSADDAPAVRRYADRRSGALAADALRLARLIETVYSAEGRRRRFERLQARASVPALEPALEAFLAAERADERVRMGRHLLAECDRALSKADPARSAALLGIMGLTNQVLAETTAALRTAPLTRTEGLRLVEASLDAALLLGGLSEREVGALRPHLHRSKRQLPPAVYARAIDELGKSLEWARARYLVDFGPALGRYQAIEPAAFGVLDEALRTGVVLALGALLDRFAADVESLRSGGHVLPELSPAAVRGENPGLARGTFRIVTPGTPAEGLTRNEIALVFDSVPDLPPVAGIITVGTPSSLSHVSLLAQNLGIPHAAVTGEAAATLRPWAGTSVVLGVSGQRRVVLARSPTLSAAQRNRIAMKEPAPHPSLTIDSQRLRLADRTVLPLRSLSSADAGVRVGPKAAELARLERLFPDRVSDAFVLPFGTFLAHVTQSDGRRSAWDRLRAAYARADRMRPEQAESFLLESLEKFRTAIHALPFRRELVRQVRDALRQLGPDQSFGAFVRSDTNVEDLEAFTGAGLNKTVPHRVGLDSTLEAIREVWASPFSERSFRWRQRILTNPEHVYPSVIVQRTVPSEISGVLVTRNLVTGDPDALTISASEGVAAVVDGGAAETVVVRSDGELELLSSSRVYARKLIPRPPREGVMWAPATKEDPLLTPSRLAEITRLAREVVANMPQQNDAWDIEFGLVDERAYLFQIRPLRPSKLASTHPFLRELDDAAQLPSTPVPLDEALP